VQTNDDNEGQGFSFSLIVGRAMLQAASRLPVTTERLWFGATSIHVGFVVDEVTMEQIRPRVQTLCEVCNFIVHNFKLEKVL